ncbi:MAG TPA: PIG-L deacetylase family protein [Dehalococcoidia bacterium]|nr:PIG-L deacetylase family protein [Dehalococcoidia bacterium]
MTQQSANLEGLAQPPAAQPDDGPKRALVIAAHPDDADFGAAGTAYLWSQNGWQFYYLVCTNGAKGSDDESISAPELIKLRRQEQRAAAAILGVKDVFFLDHEDGELVANRDLLGDVVRVIRELKPYAVFTHDPEAIIVRDAFINHSDHRVTGQVAIDAVYPAARDRLNFPEQIASGLKPHKVSEIYIWGSEKANFEVDITDAIEIKTKALRAHASQFEVDFIDNILNRWRTPEGRYIEPFRRVQMAF